MARKGDLREQRAGTVINHKSKNQEKALDRALKQVVSKLVEKWPAIELDQCQNLTGHIPAYEG